MTGTKQLCAVLIYSPSLIATGSSRAIWWICLPQDFISYIFFVLFRIFNFTHLWLHKVWLIINVEIYIFIQYFPGHCTKTSWPYMSDILKWGKTFEYFIGNPYLKLFKTVWCCCKWQEKFLQSLICSQTSHRYNKWCLNRSEFYTVVCLPNLSVLYCTV